MTDGRSASPMATTSYSSPPNLTVSRPADMDRSTRKEKKRTGPPNDLTPRPVSSWSQAPSRTSSRLTTHDSRHIDLLEALFTSHRFRIESARTMSPTSPYNEDIAERNMTRFLQGQPKAGVYSRFISTLYQEDVANKNIAESRRGSRAFSRPSSRSRMSGNSAQSTPQRKRDSRGYDARRQDGQITRPTSQEGLRSGPRPIDESVAAAREQWRRRSNILRAQISEPNLAAERSVSNPAEQLTLPAAYRQGNKWSHSPAPDSPTIPIPPRGIKNMNEYRISKDGANQYSWKSISPSSTPSSAPRRNVRDLSINTELAGRGRSIPKISHRAIQPPTPNGQDTRQNPSIAEVMNSPLPAGSPKPISSVAGSSDKVQEIMDMFKQAYVPARTPNSHSSHSFESLQDAIIREVNSHEAFRHVPVPEAGPPFTPSPTRNTFNMDPSPPTPMLSRSVSAKEGQFSKLIRKSSFKRGHRRNSESRKSISTFIPKSSEKILRLAPSSSRRRRHTDAPLPSAGLFDAKRPAAVPVPERPEQITYMDMLMQSARHQPRNPSSGPDTNTKSPKNLVSQPKSLSLNTQNALDRIPSVYYMRAQASASRNRLSTMTADTDDEIIHLPSVETPRAQVHGTDKHNVKYIVENTSASNASRLMNWAKKGHQSETDDDSLVLNETDSFPLPPRTMSGRQHPQLRNSRSLDSY